ncbi:MAG: Uma2 family endonuclease [Microcoleus sp. SU_5_3]|nr:Uma2 family endonuclease [Microcoleus sp. SU_5_3]
MSQSVVPAIEEKLTDTSVTLTFEEYKVYQSNDDVKYELYEGKLIPMPTATILHIKICEYLVYHLQRYLERQLNLVVKTGLGVRTAKDKSRIPDVVVCTRNLWEQAEASPGAGILDFEEKPLLVIEVVSENRRQDYVIKRAEYEQANVPEYIIVDPAQNRERVRVLAFQEGEESYTQIDYLLGQEMVSVVFPDLRLSVDEILCPPLVDDLINEEKAHLQEIGQQLATERQRAENERQRAENERQRADNERQRAERLAARLRELEIDPDTV